MKPPLASWGSFAWKQKCICGLFAAWMLLAAGLARAQEGLRNSMAGDAAAAAMHQQQASQDYTVKSGDFRLLVVPSLEMDWDDNITISASGQQQDFILRPLVQFTGTYPITQNNTLNLSAGIGYDEYLEHSQYSALRVDSGSQLAFDMYIKDFLINFHDRFQYSQDPGTQPGVAGGAAGTALYGGLNNTAGLTTTWDLEDLVLTLGYDHANFVPSSGEFSYLEDSTELPMIRAGFRFTPALTAGLEATASFTSYNQQVLNNYNSYSIGPYADWQPGTYFHVQPRAGYVINQFQHTSESYAINHQLNSGLPIVLPTGESIQTADLGSWYADLTISHQVIDAVKYGLSVGRETQAGIQADAIEDWYVRPSVDLAIVKDLSLTASLPYEHGNQGVNNISGNLTETFDWFGGNLSASYPIMKKWLLSLDYRLTLRSSDANERGYTQNVVGIRLAYHP